MARILAASRLLSSLTAFTMLARHCGLKEENEWGEVQGKSEKMRPDPEFNTTIPCLILHNQKLTNDWGLHRLTGLVCVLMNKKAITLYKEE